MKSLLSFDTRVLIRTALAAKRREYIADWQLAQEFGSTNVTYWAEMIQRVNDADLEFVQAEVR